ncbi:MAG: sugar transferase [Desulfuromonadales bacterium]|nr:sugar transferase [Desulfuromonadales bacterium]MDW7757183.1 sugar transferase [Desulfuromonadales bacterium]
MLRQQARLFTRLTMLTDSLTLGLAFAIAYIIRGQIGIGLHKPIEYLWVFLVVSPVWFYLLTKHGFYQSIRRLSLFDMITRLASVHLAGGIVVASLIYFLDRDKYSRGLYLLFLLLSFLLFVLQKILVKVILGSLRRRKLNVRHILVVGTQEKARRFCQLIESHKDWGLEIVGFVQVTPGTLQESVEGHRVLGRADDLIAICKDIQVDEAVFCIPKDYVVSAEPYLQDLEELGVTVRMVMDFFEASFYRKEISLFHNELPILTYYPKAFDAHQLFLKRVLDVTGALAGLAFTGLIFPFVALAIKLDSPGPLLFSQPRVRVGNRLFNCWKFRSMHIDAEERKEGLMARNEMKGAMFKMKNDPRVTRVGRFLRKTSLDELPQFWNVLKGDMSLVGTRPPTPAEVEQYENWQRRRISIKPGITGMWQVSGRSTIEDFNEIVRLDLHYIDHWSLWLDIRILFKTIAVVFSRKGSC